MKKVLLSLTVLASSIFALQGQNNMVIHQKNGSTLSLPLQSIDSVRFNLVPPPAMKRIFQNNGNILSLSVADIDSITFTIPNRSTLPTLTTQAVTVLSSSSAFGGGNISADGGSAVTQRGVCWNTSPNPTIANNFTVDGTGLGSYGSTMQPLTPATTYYVRAYATNANGTSYGSQVSFVTAPANNSGNLPTISTNQVVYMDSLSAFCGGNITADGGLAVTARGVCWAIGSTPTINNSRTLDGSGAGNFNSRLANLLPNTTYFVRAYATNDAGTSYGVSYSFTTKGFATLATDSVFDIMALSAKAQGAILSDGGASVSQRGFCWSNSPNPTINDSIIEGGVVKNFIFNAVLASFGPQPSSVGVDGELIYISGTNPGCSQISDDLTGKIALIERGGCAFVDKVINAQNAGAKGVIVFQNSDEEPIVMGGTHSSINIPSVMISRANGLALVSMQNNQSVLANIKETLVSVGLIGANQFESKITNLLPDTLYYLRSFAQNKVGVSYGNTISFKTQNGIPKITLDSVYNIKDVSAEVSAITLEENGGASIKEKGFCWSLTPNPTINDSRTNNGSGLGHFWDFLSSFYPDKTYYLRAYAKTDAGVGYSNQISFRTQLGLVSLFTDSVFFVGTNVVARGNVTSSTSATINDGGFCWSLKPNPTINNGDVNAGVTSSLGVFTGGIYNLFSDSIYYIRAFVTTIQGTSYGNEISFKNRSAPYSNGSVFCANGQTIVKDIISPGTGKTWMDRNLGATQIATSSSDGNAHGDLYQWGRGNDGHQCRNSPFTNIQSSVDQPGHDSFIFGNWRTPLNNNLWQGVNGVNNPCPSGYRLPTSSEFQNEISSFGWQQGQNAAGAFASPLKLTMGGVRGYSNGGVGNVGSQGRYWTSSVSAPPNTSSSNIAFIYSLNASINAEIRGNGCSVRCIKD